MGQFPWYAEYRLGRLGGKPDALTRRSGDLPKEGVERLVERVQTLLKPENYSVHRQSSDYDTIQAQAQAVKLAPSSSPPSPSPPLPPSPSQPSPPSQFPPLALSPSLPSPLSASPSLPPSLSPPSPPSPSPLLPLSLSLPPTEFESLLGVVYASDPFPSDNV